MISCILSVALTMLILFIFKACGILRQPQLLRVRRRVKHRISPPRSAKRRSKQGVLQPKASNLTSDLTNSAPTWPQNVPVKIGTIDTSLPDNSGVDPTKPELGVDPTESHPSEPLQPKPFWGPSVCCPEPGTREHEIAYALWKQQWENLQWLKEGGQDLGTAEQMPDDHNSDWGNWHNEIYEDPSKPPIDEEWYPGSPGRPDHYVMHVYPSSGSGSLKFEKE